MDARQTQRHVYVANLEAAKVWKITEERGKPAVPPEEIASRRCRELWLDGGGTLFGDDLPVKEAGDLRVWKLNGAGPPSDDALGWGVLRSPDGYAYALEGRRRGTVPGPAAHLRGKEGARPG